MVMRAAPVGDDRFLLSPIFSFLLFFFVLLLLLHTSCALDIRELRRCATLVSAFLLGADVLCAAAAATTNPGDNSRAHMHHSHVNAHAIMHVIPDRSKVYRRHLAQGARIIERPGKL